MPKSTPESDYIKYMASLQSKIRAEEIGLQSWKGAKRVQIAPVKPSINDLLTGGDKLNKTQQLQSKMLDEYLEKQKTPITRIVQKTDEYGNEMYDPVTGRPIMIKKEFKYHAIEPPELLEYDIEINDIVERPPIIEVDPDTGVEYEVPQSPIVNRHVHTIPTDRLANADQYFKEKFGKDIRELDKEIKLASSNAEQLEDMINQIIQDKAELKQETQQYLKELVEQYDKQKSELLTGIVKGRKKLLKNLNKSNDEQRESIIRPLEAELKYKDLELKQARNNLRMYKTILIPDLQKKKDDLEIEYENTITGLNNVIKENKDRLKAYQQELINMNIGGLNTNQNIDETDAEYAERLQAIANETVPTERNLEKARQALKEDVREKLGTVFRDRALIDSIVNTLDKEEDKILENIEEPLYQLNTQFSGFKTAFEKRYGEFNKTIKLETILEEIAKYLERRTLDLSEETQLILKPNQPRSVSESLNGDVESISTPPIRTIPKKNLSSSSSSSSFLSPLLNPSFSSQYTGIPVEVEGAEEYKEGFEDPETGLILPSSIEGTSSVPTIVPEPLPSSADTRVLRFVYPTGVGEEPRRAFLKRAFVEKKKV
jgi:hypothetical protein